MKPIETARPVINASVPSCVPALGHPLAAQPEKNRDEPDRIDRHKKRDKREQEFFEVGLHRVAISIARHSLLRKAGAVAL